MSRNRQRFFQLDYDEIYYIFDKEGLTHSIDSTDFSSFDESLSGTDVIDILNKQDELIKELNKEVRTINECYQTYKDTVEDILLKYSYLFSQNQICEIENELFIELYSYNMESE